MKLNRRTFFQTAALLPAAVLQSNGRAIPLQPAPMPVPVEVDLAEPGAEAYIGHSATDLFVRLEELDPGDPGELSGAVLRIGDSEEDLSISATIGDVLQRDGSRTSHLLGFMEAEGMLRLASLDPIGGERDFAVFFTGNLCHPEGAYFAVGLVLYPGDSPELHLNAGRHCLGVLRGELVSKFFACLGERLARGEVGAN